MWYTSTLFTFELLEAERLFGSRVLGLKLSQNASVDVLQFHLPAQCGRSFAVDYFPELIQAVKAWERLHPLKYKLG